MTLTTPEASTNITLPQTLQRLVLTGFMGAGKTTIGRLLAAALGWEFLDLDAHIESRTGQSVPALFATLGEPAFRRLESSALANALARPHTVIALGGGTPEHLTNRLLLEQTPATTVIYLEAPFPTLYDRCLLQSLSRPDHIRPLLTTPAAAEALHTARQPLYTRLARITLPTAPLTPTEAVQALLHQLSVRNKPSSSMASLSSIDAGNKPAS